MQSIVIYYTLPLDNATQKAVYIISDESLKSMTVSILSVPVC